MIFIRHRKIPGLLLALAGLAATGLGVAGCAGGGDQQPAAVASHYSGEECDTMLEGTKQVHFKDAHGTQLSGVEVGGGSVGFVLSHQNPGDVCDWLPYAREASNANKGYRMLCLDFAGYGNSETPADGDTRDHNIVAAAKYLRSEGVQTIVLMGASMGANAAVIAGTELQPPPAAVISLSAPAVYLGLDATEGAAKLAVPVLYVAGQGDQGGSFAEYAQTLYDATPTTIDRRLQLAFSTAHGVNLLSPVDADASHTRAALADFLGKYAPTNS
jgi:dienelactone hydrolase